MDVLDEPWLQNHIHLGKVHRIGHLRYFLANSFGRIRDIRICRAYGLDGEEKYLDGDWTVTISRKAVILTVKTPSMRIRRPVVVKNWTRAPGVNIFESPIEVICGKEANDHGVFDGFA